MKSLFVPSERNIDTIASQSVSTIPKNYEVKEEHDKVIASPILELENLRLDVPSNSRLEPV